MDKSSLWAPWQNGPYKTHRTSPYKLKRCSNKECCKQCKYVNFKEYSNTHQTLRNNYCLCVFGFFCFLFSIFNYLKDFSKKCWIIALVRSLKNFGCLNQFSAAANLTLSQHFLEKKKKKNCPFTLFYKATKEFKKTTKEG